MRNLYAGQEAKVRNGHGTTDWFQIGKGVRQCCILSHCLSNLYAEYIMRNAGLEEAQAGIKIARRNINSLVAQGDPVWILELGRSLGEANGNPLQYSCLERGAWWATVHRVTKSWTQLSTQSSQHIRCILKKGAPISWQHPMPPKSPYLHVTCR